MKHLFIILLAGNIVAVMGCQSLPGQDKNTLGKTIKVGNLDRTYYLHVPANLPKAKPAALVLVFHGGSGTPALIERESKFSELADREGFLLAYPEGIGKSWNDGRAITSIQSQRDKVDDIAFVVALIDDIAKDHLLNKKMIYATGSSNGGMFVHHLAVNLSSQIAGIASVIGGLPEPSSKQFKPEQPVSILIFQGTDDPLVPYNGGYITLPWAIKKRGRIISTDDVVKMWVERNNCQREAIVEELPDKEAKDNCRVKRFSYTNGKNGSEIVLYRIEGGGHTWPGGSQYLPKGIIGGVCHDINATTIIWDFFKTHPKP